MLLRVQRNKGVTGSRTKERSRMKEGGREGKWEKERREKRERGEEMGRGGVGKRVGERRGEGRRGKQRRGERRGEGRIGEPPKRAKVGSGKGNKIGKILSLCPWAVNSSGSSKMGVGVFAKISKVVRFLFKTHPPHTNQSYPYAVIL